MAKYKPVRIPMGAGKKLLKDGKPLKLGTS
jgi:hypothetical protein